MNEGTWVPAYIAIGSNLQEPAQQVIAASARLGGLPRTHWVSRSALYRTRPIGPQDQPDFINAAAGVLTQLSARELLNALLDVERSMGRDRRERWGPRIIDLDLIWIVGEPIDEPGLQVPHPRVSARNFVLYPLADIASELKIPGLGWVRELKALVGGEGLIRIERSDSKT